MTKRRIFWIVIAITVALLTGIFSNIASSDLQIKLQERFGSQYSLWIWIILGFCWIGTIILAIRDLAVLSISPADARKRWLAIASPLRAELTTLSALCSDIVNKTDLPNTKVLAPSIVTSDDLRYGVAWNNITRSLGGYHSACTVLQAALLSAHENPKSWWRRRRLRQAAIRLQRSIDRFRSSLPNWDDSIS